MLVVGVAGGLQLDRGVLDVEVPGQALLHRVEHLRGVAVAEALVVDDHVGGEHRQARGDRVGVQVVHVADVLTSRMCRRTSSRSTFSGAASSSMCTAWRNSRTPGAAITAPITTETIASARVKPVRAITAAATSTPTEVAVSVATSRNAPRRFRLAAARPVQQREADEVADQADRREHRHAARVNRAGSTSRRMPSTKT